ncbi:MAG: hypothetical protein JNK02_06780 [Planctomycetes bacterium]|nr:hypothetical protein [Planctomycetota bacterium]
MLVRSLTAAGLAALLSACSSTGKTLAVSAHAIVVDDYSVDGAQDEELQGYGVEGHLLLLGPDLSLGYEQREIGGEDVDELFLGGRCFVIDSPIVSPYLSARLRYSDGFEDSDSDSYSGWAAGVGAFVWFLGPTYIDLNVHYEDLFSDPDVGGSETGFDGITGAIGLGLAF